MFYTKLKDESGMALLITVLVTVVGSLLMASYMSVAINESRSSVWQKHRVQSLFLAEAGIEKAIYYLNNPSARPSEWLDTNSELLPTPLNLQEQLEDGLYSFSLHDRNEISWLPERTYLIRSTGVIPRISGDNIERKVSCIVYKDDLLVSALAALCIFDGADLEDELINFNSTQWRVSGKDIDDKTDQDGVMGIAVANTGDNVDVQLDKRIDQVEGADPNDSESDGDYTLTGIDAILQDPGLPQDLSEYLEQFLLSPKMVDISGFGNTEGYLGAPDDCQILYADLTKGKIQHLGGRSGYGVLILEGPGEFEMQGNSEWYGLVLCISGANIDLRGGGNTAAHIYGCAMVEDCSVTLNGTSDIRYSSGALKNIEDQLIPHQVIAWSEGWGNAL